jgi:mannose/fructose-specific phosphotransferase system component IIA
LPAHIGALSKTGACKNKSSAQTVFGTQTNCCGICFVATKQDNQKQTKQHATGPELINHSREQVLKGVRRFLAHSV